MDRTNAAYEAPMLRCDGDVVRQTRTVLMTDIEDDGEPRNPLGSVGFGI